MSVKDKIVAIKEMLQPTGRAFRVIKGGYKEALHSGLADSETQFYEDVSSVMDSTFPDNDNFTPEDATDWERRLGLVTNSLTPLADRKLAIQRKRSFPGRNPARLNYLYLQKQLQDAGFPVYVYENIPEQNPGAINPAILSDLEYNNFEYGGMEYGSNLNHLIARSIYNSEDINFNTGINNRCLFYIGGNPNGTSVNITASREVEFRQLVLRTKAVNKVAVLFINFI